MSWTTVLIIALVLIAIYALLAELWAYAFVAGVLAVILVVATYFRTRPA